MSGERIFIATGKPTASATCTASAAESTRAGCAAPGCRTPPARPSIRPGRATPARPRAPHRDGLRRGAVGRRRRRERLRHLQQLLLVRGVQRERGNRVDRGFGRRVGRHLVFGEVLAARGDRLAAHPAREHRLAVASLPPRPVRLRTGRGSRERVAASGSRAARRRSRSCEARSAPPAA